MIGYEIGDIIILNEKAKSGLPNRVGERAMILGKHDGSNYNYIIEFDDKSTSPAKDTEINDLSEGDIFFMNYIFTRNKVLYNKINQVVEILKVDYINRQAEIKDENGLESVVGFNSLNPIDYTEVEEEIITGELEIGELHNEVCKRLNDICVRKNNDYKNSFSDTWNEFGLISLVIRLNDKMLRLKQLSKYDAQVKDESIKDTLLDMANYCILGIIELEKEE